MLRKPLWVRTVIIGGALVVSIVAGSLGFGPAIASKSSSQSLAPAPIYQKNGNVTKIPAEKKKLKGNCFTPV